MARDENINNAIWDEIYGLSAPAKLVFIWSFTNRRCDFSGIYQVPLEAIVNETKHTEQDVRDALEELERAEKVLYDGTWLFVKSRVKRIKTRTVAMCTRIARDLNEVPESHPYREQLLDLHGDHVWQSNSAKGFERRTIREVLGSLPGATGVGQGSHPPNGATASLDGSYPGGTGVAHMTETKTVTKTPPRGEGAGRGGKYRAPDRQPYAPDPDMLAIQTEHFPMIEVSTIEDAAYRLRRGGLAVTPESVREVLAAVYRDLGLEVEGVTC
jgi:hypothetical protein